jgi:hypothetical protein
MTITGSLIKPVLPLDSKATALCQHGATPR